MRRALPTGAWSLALALACAPAPAFAWELLRTENADVEAGNAAFRAGRLPEALPAYDRAARSLPSEPGVHLDRGVVLMAQAAQAEDPATRERLETSAREALVQATAPVDRKSVV